MHVRLTFIFIVCCLNVIVAQLPYTQNNYSVVLDASNLSYGISTNFAGIDDTLLLDIYKPRGDQNCLRPLMILVHGGSWIAGSKYDANIVLIAQEMASKGYVVAAINYRLGMHKTSNYSMYWACNNSISAPCAYIADSSEIFRAIFRGMQDTKGAIRFMKQRAMQDSTDIQNVYLAGESAGGFIVLAAAYMQEFQKPLDCFNINDAITPDPDLLSCLPAGYSLSRPDLGSIEGNLNSGSTNSDVQGVANFYGGMMDPTLLATSQKKPALYLFHQGSDVVVDYNYNRVLGRINWECYAQANVCQQYPNTPFAYGGEGLRRQLDSMGFQAPLHRSDIIYNYNYLNDCTANGHSIDNYVLRSTHMAELFAIVIDSSGNIPPMNCSVTSVNEFSSEDVFVFPNPGQGKINIIIPGHLKVEEVRMIDLSGKDMRINYTYTGINQIELNEKQESGIYFLKIKTYDGVLIKKVMVFNRN